MKTESNNNNKEKKEALITDLKKDENTNSDYGKEVVIKHSFYKDGYLKSLGIVLFTLLTLATSVYWSAHMFMYEPPVKYIPVDAENKVLKEVPESQAVMTDAQLKQWTYDALSVIFSYDYYRVDTHGAKIRKYFSTKSFEEYMEVFKESSDIKRVQRNFFIVDVEPSMPELVQSGQLNNGALYWRYKIDLRRLFVNHLGFIKEKNVFIVNIVRSNSPEAQDGVLIYNIREDVQESQ
jgi:hypothetical protein